MMSRTNSERSIRQAMHETPVRAQVRERMVSGRDSLFKNERDTCWNRVANSTCEWSGVLLPYQVTD